MHMDFVNTEVQQEEKDHKRKSQGKKHGLEEQVQVREGDPGSEKKKGGFVLKEV